jgi:hypothetical protein
MAQSSEEQVSPGRIWLCRDKRLNCIMHGHCLHPFFFYFLWTGIWIQGLHLELLHKLFLVKVLLEIGCLKLLCLGWLWTAILLISAFGVGRITSVSYQHPLSFHFVDDAKDFFFPLCVCGGYWGLNSGPCSYRQVVYHLSHTSNPFYAVIIFKVVSCLPRIGLRYYCIQPKVLSSDKI